MEGSNVFNEYIKKISDVYCEGLSYLEEYCEYILEFSDYSIEDIVTVQADLGNHRLCDMVICPKSCIIEGEGILNPDYFIGLEEKHNEYGEFVGWSIIQEVPDNLKIEGFGRL